MAKTWSVTQVGCPFPPVLLTLFFARSWFITSLISDRFFSKSIVLNHDTFCSLTVNLAKSEMGKLSDFRATIITGIIITRGLSTFKA
jgi:hypothetical protein